MAEPVKPKSAHRLSESQIKQLKATLKESANKYDELLEHISNFQREEDKKKKNEIEEIINNELKSTHDHCLKLQREIETIEHKARAAAKSADPTKKNVGAFAADFRLTPEEQDIAYEFKAHVMRKIHSQNQNIKKELELHEKKADLKKCQQTYKKQVEDQQKSQTTLVSLANVYEKRAVQAQKQAKELESRLKEADSLINMYDEMYHMNGGDPGKVRKRVFSSAKMGKPNDIIRENEIMRDDNEKLKKLVSKLKGDNNELVKIAQQAESERDEIKHRFEINERAKDELQLRYEKEKKQHKALKSSITQQTSNWIQEKKGMRMVEDRERQDQVVPASPLAAKERLHQIPVKKNTDKPRQMLEVK